MDGNLTLVDAFIPRAGVLDLKSPIVRVLEVERESGIRAVRLHANGQ